MCAPPRRDVAAPPTAYDPLHLERMSVAGLA